MGWERIAEGSKEENAPAAPLCQVRNRLADKRDYIEECIAVAPRTVEKHALTAPAWKVRNEKRREKKKTQGMTRDVVWMDM
ncbi:MAG: hypothetical protein PHR35_20970 [Kiritimatiellae bacterium]|nr:hypothetical protein [Kiritimatiellia bacterium]